MFFINIKDLYFTFNDFPKIFLRFAKCKTKNIGNDVVFRKASTMFNMKAILYLLI